MNGSYLLNGILLAAAEPIYKSFSVSKLLFLMLVRSRKLLTGFLISVPSCFTLEIIKPLWNQTKSVYHTISLTKQLSWPDLEAVCRNLIRTSHLTHRCLVAIANKEINIVINLLLRCRQSLILPTTIYNIHVLKTAHRHHYFFYNW